MRGVARVRRLAGMATLAVGLCGCATLTRGLDDEVAIVKSVLGK